MVNELRAALPSPKPFIWAREYGPLWSGDKDSAFWLAPGPDDVICIDGVNATLAEHTARRRPPLLHKANECVCCGVRPKVPGWRHCRDCYEMKCSPSRAMVGSTVIRSGRVVQ